MISCVLAYSIIFSVLFLLGVSANRVSMNAAVQQSFQEGMAQAIWIMLRIRQFEVLMMIRLTWKTIIQMVMYNLQRNRGQKGNMIYHTFKKEFSCTGIAMKNHTVAFQQ